MRTHEEIINLISIIRNADPNTIYVFTNGSCFDFYLMLKLFEPSAIPYYDSNHVITKIGKRFYDINGEVERLTHYDLRKEPRILKDAYTWSRNAF